MRLQVNDYGFDSLLPENEQESTIENTPKMFSILSDALYKNKILAVIRELSCNARDAQHDAGKPDVPFKIKLPTQLEPTFRIEDSGVGITPAEMRKVYLTYGRSTKTENDNAIGALGLGSKSPFAYTKSSFIVKTRWYTPPSSEPVAQVSEYTFFIFINRGGKPAISLVGIDETDQPVGGLTVEFAVKPEDISKFIKATDTFYHYWDEVLPDFIDYQRDQVLTTKVEKILEGKGWYLERRNWSSDHQGAVAVMGNVPYPILADQISGMSEDLRTLARSAFVIKFPLGALAFSPSREDLSYDEFTCKNLIERLKEVRDEIGASTRERIFKKGMTHLEFRLNFYEAIRDLQTAMRMSYGSNADLKWVCSFFLGKNQNDSVQYDGVTFKIQDLLNQRIQIDKDGYQPFGISQRVLRGSKNRLYLSTATHFDAKALKQIDYTQITRNEGWTRTVHVGDNFSFDWQSKVFAKRKDEDNYTQFQRMINLPDAFSWETRNVFRVTNRKAVFVVNDEGSAGEQKFKHWLEVENPVGDYFFIRHNPKEIEAADVAEKVTELLKDGMKGAEIVYCSTLKDHRPEIVKVKTDPSTLKVHTYEFNYYTEGFAKVNVDAYLSTRVPVNAIQVPLYSQKQTLMKVADLLAAKNPWLYVVKTRSKREVFDYAQDDKDQLYLTQTLVRYGNSGTLHKAIATGLFDDVHYTEAKDDRNRVTRNYPILVLNEGQIKWLLAKGVKLAQVRLHAIEKLKKELETSKFIDAIAEDVVMDRLSTIKTIWNQAMPHQREAMLASDGVFQKYIKEYSENLAKRDTPQRQRSYILMALYRELIHPRAEPPVDRAERIQQRLDDNYPLLNMIDLGRLRSPGIDKLFEYVEAQDQRLEVLF